MYGSGDANFVRSNMIVAITLWVPLCPPEPLLPDLMNFLVPWSVASLFAWVFAIDIFLFTGWGLTSIRTFLVATALVITLPAVRPLVFVNDCFARTSRHNFNTISLMYLVCKVYVSDAILQISINVEL